MQTATVSKSLTRSVQQSFGHRQSSANCRNGQRCAVDGPHHAVGQRQNLLGVQVMADDLLHIRVDVLGRHVRSPLPTKALLLLYGSLRLFGVHAHQTAATNPKFPRSSPLSFLSDGNPLGQDMRGSAVPILLKIKSRQFVTNAKIRQQNIHTVSPHMVCSRMQMPCSRDASRIFLMIQIVAYFLD